MVSGRLQCLGSSQHLKSRYGAGYQLDISFSSPTKKQSFIQLFTHTSSANATTTSPCPSSSPAQDSPHPLIDAMIEEEHSNYIRLKLSQNIDLADTFTFLEKLKFQEEKNSSIDGGSTTSTSSCSIQDYSLSQSTLEQIFINFAKHQHDEEEKDHQRN